MARYEEITIDQGSNVAIEVQCINEDGSKKSFVNYSVKAKMKLNYNADSSNTIDFNTIIATPAADGIVTMSLTHGVTDALLPKKRYLFDLEASFVDSSSNTIIERILEGNIYVNPSITKPTVT
jgi:hypothetical protein